MAIRVTCGCGKILQARSEDAGRQAKCPSCGTILTLPSDEAEAPPELSLPLERIEEPGDELSQPLPLESAEEEAEAIEPAPPQRRGGRTFECRRCRGRFGVEDVYDDGGVYICRRCHERDARPVRASSRRPARSRRIHASPSRRGHSDSPWTSFGRPSKMWSRR